jgi:hypothetical protein
VSCKAFGIGLYWNKQAQESLNGIASSPVLALEDQPTASPTSASKHSRQPN